MNPRAPQQPGMQPNLQSDRPNPWGGGVPAMPAPQPSAAPPASNVLNLQCPHCRAGLTLKQEHIGIDGGCIHCNTPIRAVSYPNGQIAIELIEAVVSEVPVDVDVEDVAVELHPTVPVSVPHQEVANQAAPSLWQNPPVQQESAPHASEPVAPLQTHAVPLQQEPAPHAPEPVAPLQTHAVPPQQENSTPDWAQQTPSMFQTGSAPQPTNPQTQQPAPAPAFPSPSGAMPWTDAAPQPPVIEQENYESFKAVTAFENPPQQEPENLLNTEAPIDPNGQNAAGSSATTSKSRLARASHKPRLGLLKWIAALIILGGIGYLGYTFAPKEKVAQMKLWVGEFVKPALDVLNKEGRVETIPTIPVPSTTPDPNPPLSPSAPATATPSAPASSSITPEASPPDSPPASEIDIAPPPDPVSENLRVNVGGTSAIRQFYRAPNIEARLLFLVDPEQSRRSLETYAERTQILPKLDTVSFRQASLDSASNRWFGIFEVAEKENEKLHRWIVVEDENGEFKLDWNLYEQLIDDALPRFLDDPTASPREFRLAIRKGESVPDNNNPWNSEAIGLLIQSPFDSQPARPIVIKQSDFKGLGFTENLTSSTSKIARVEMAWLPSEFDPNSRVPVITRLIGWGAW